VEDDLRQQGVLRVSGSHAPTTVRRCLANWSTLTVGAEWGRFPHRTSNRPSAPSSMQGFAMCPVRRHFVDDLRRWRGSLSASARWLAGSKTSLT
jgi:hypothetical protein